MSSIYGPRQGCWLAMRLQAINRILLVSLFFLFPSEALQAATLTGKVLDERKNSMLTVTVIIQALQVGTLTDEKGEFRLENLPPGTYAVEFQFIGYKKETRDVTVSDVQPVALEVKMTLEAVIGGDVTITGERDRAGELTGSSQSVLVLPEAKLEEVRGQTLGETLEALPGVSALTTGPAVSKPVLRGVHSARVLILNAGLNQEGQNWGGDHAPEIDPFAPSRIEVLKGAASVQYGAGAIGGVIRIEPPDLREVPGVSGRLNVSSFSNNWQGAGSLFLEGASRRVPGLAWRVQGSLRRAGDARAPVHIIGNSGFDERDYSAAIGLIRDNAEVEVYFSHFGTQIGIYRDSHIGNTTDLQRAIDRGQPTVVGSFTYDIDNPRQVVDHDLLSVRTQFWFEGKGNLVLRYGQQYNRRQEWDAHSLGGGVPTVPGFDQGLLSQSGDLIFQHNPAKGWFGKIGVSGMKQRNTRFSTGFLIPDFLAYNGGVFALESWANERVTFESGIRFDYRWLKISPNSSNRASEQVVGRTHTFTNATGVVGLIYQLSSTWAAGANIGQAWRPPGVNELYSNGVHHGTAQFEVGDLTLKTETSINTDLTLRYQGDRGKGEIGVFRSQYRNFINLLPANEFVLTIRGAFPKFAYFQSNARIQGFDGYLEYELNRFLSINISASLVRGRDTTNDQPLFLMPSDRLIAGLDFHIPPTGRFLDQGIGFETKLIRRQTSFPAGIDYVDPPAGYGLLDFHYHAQMAVADQLVRAQFGVHNIFNTRYRDYLSRFRYFIDNPGRNITFRLSVPFGQTTDN